MVEHDKVGVATRHDAAALILDVRGACRHLGCHADGDIGAGDAQSTMFLTPWASVSTEPAMLLPSASQHRLSFMMTSMPPLV